MMLTTIGVGVVSLFLIFILWLLDLKRKYRRIAHIPGPERKFLIGNALDIGRNPVEVLQNTWKLMKKHGKYLQLWVGPNRPFLWISDFKFMEYILSSTRHIEKSQDYMFLHDWLGSGLLTSGGEKWKQRRKIITPSFHFKVLEQFVEVFNTSGDTLLEKLSKEVGKESVDIYPFISLYTLDNICETAMGASIDAQLNANSDYVRAVKNACNILIERTFSPWKQFNLLFWFSKSHTIQTRSLKILHSLTTEIIAKRKIELEKERQEEKLAGEPKAEEEEHLVLGLKKRMAFLDLLMRSTYDGVPLTDLELREEVDTFMFAGHDTSSSAISFTLYSLSREPEIQEKVVKELRLIFEDDKTRPTTYKDCMAMKYMELVIKETLRLYPSVPYYAREIKEELNFDGLIMPPGLTVTLYPFVMHRDPDLFPDPEKFIPERFLADNIRERSPYAYLPFGAGLRNCIGQKFAMLELKATLSKFLRTFEVLPVKEHELIFAAAGTLTSASGICVQLKNREF